MLDLTNHLRCNNFSDRWLAILTWLIANVGPIKLDKLGHTQGQGWLIIRTITARDSHYQVKLYIDDCDYEVMFKLACL
jgi:hypothetical protein